MFVPTWLVVVAVLFIPGVLDLAVWAMLATLLTIGWMIYGAFKLVFWLTRWRQLGAILGLCLLAAALGDSAVAEFALAVGFSVLLFAVLKFIHDRQEKKAPALLGQMEASLGEAKIRITTGRSLGRRKAPTRSERSARSRARGMADDEPAILTQRPTIARKPRK